MERVMFNHHLFKTHKALLYMIQQSYKVLLQALQYNDHSSAQWALSSQIGKPIERRLNCRPLQKLSHFVLIQPVIQLQSSWIDHLDLNCKIFLIQLYQIPTEQLFNWSWVP